ncbi:MAG: substrate-binding domain-containing protein [Gaiellaceae bacterium]
MTREPEQRLSPRALYELLDASHAESTAALERTQAMAETHPRRSRERRLIGVTTNAVPWQMDLTTGYWRHHALDDILAGIRAHADASEIDLLVLTGLSSEVTGESTHYGDLCRAHGAEGIILSSFVPEEPELAALAASEFPCVSIDTSAIGPHTSYVASDSVGGAVAAVRHLASLGRKRIAFLGGWGHEPVSMDRRLGYESVLAELGLEQRDDYMLEGGWLHGQAREETRRVLALAEPPDAIFCASDRMAVGALLACEEAGLEIPGDIAIIGFDDEYFAGLCSPSLSTIRQDRIGLGTAAVEAVLRMLDQPEAPPPTIVLPVELVVRETTDPGSISSNGDGNRMGADTTREDPLRERLSVGELFHQLGTPEVFRPKELGDTTAGRREKWSPEERRTIALASDTTPAQSYRHAFFDEVFYGLRASAHARSADLLILTHVWPEAGLPPLLDLCHRYKADGIIVSSLPPGDPEIVALTESGFPCVAFDVELLGRRSAFVSFDNVAAGIEVVRHLAESGRKRIAFLGGRGDERPSVDRHFGYKSELARLGLPCREGYTHAAHWLHDRAYQATRLMLDLPEPPDAIFAASDIMAIGAMAAIEDAGLQIPGDVAVAGFDDIDVARMVEPALTSVRQNQTRLVTALIDAMFDLLDRPEVPPRAKILPIELIVRASSVAE